ncbi:hypothetical protein Aduo_006138 [Ancylostoma duodenale]
MKLSMEVTAAVLLLLCYRFNAEPIRRPRQQKKASSLQEPATTVSSMLRTNHPVRSAAETAKKNRILEEAAKRVRKDVSRLHEEKNENESRLNYAESKADEIYRIVQPYENENENESKLNYAEAKADEIYEIVRPYGEEYEERSGMDTFESQVERIYQITQKDYGEEEKEEPKNDEFGLDKLMQDSVVARGKDVNFNIFIFLDSSNRGEQVKDVMERLRQKDSRDVLVSVRTTLRGLYKAA